ncbi:RIP metalloprotease RseP [Hominifimenecus microfluidus]|uniref:Zinc metalloprotease n=1 Tax=Hominifimenecus microfluidus TaxID=2885348 RepID=A0AAE3JGL6_9FIRM|nr:RIP metalloprotease RseP [Hominifimenecus microfluidus]MCC2232720.1 RIP metalloprotease RseP [Hominifimenecus microfluidus]
MNLSIIFAIMIFSFLVITHEFGHFLMAKKAGIGVIEFSVGMGPRLLHFQRGETMYSLKLIPFGGSCMMVGEDDSSDAENAFGKKSVWARILVVAGGPLFNFISAFILALILVLCEGENPAKVTAVADTYGAGPAGIQVGDVITEIDGDSITIGRDIALHFMLHPLDGSTLAVTYERDGQEYTTQLDPNYTRYRTGITYTASNAAAVLSAVEDGLPAAEAGIQAGDVITAINGTEIVTGQDLQQYFDEHPLDGNTLTITYERNGAAYEAELTPVLGSTPALGMTAIYTHEKTGPVGTVVGAWHEMGYSVKTVFASLKMLITGQASVKDMSGPVGIVSVISSTVQASEPDGLYYVFLNLANLAVFLSVNLGVFNLFPLPALDGGRLLFLLIEAVRRKPIPPEKEGMVHTAGFVLLMCLMVFVLYNDIVRLFQ